MIEITDKTKCCGCKACEQICPKQCIVMQDDIEGFWYPMVNQEECINCDLCIKTCPELNLLDSITVRTCFAVKNPDSTVREKSSSGGVFYALAQYVINGGGIVFGAKFNENWEIIHDFIRKEEDIPLLMGSKYVQSNIKDTFYRTKEFLRKGITVLFTGTPCQIAGLKLFLKKDYTNLITMDFICHGVPSPLIWETYLNKKVGNKNKIKSISFRDKSYGWKRFSLNVISCDINDSFLEALDENLFIKGFLKDLYLRPSCYSCSFKNDNSGSDIVVGDFWGIQNFLPNIDDNKGVSAVLIRTKKGEECFEKLNLSTVCVNYEDIVRYNSALVKSVNLPKQRGLFFNEFYQKDVITTLSSFTKNCFNLKSFFRKELKRIMMFLGIFEIINKWRKKTKRK